MASTWSLTRAAGILHSGGLLVYPTEAVFGLGCNPLDAFAVMRLLHLKGRDPDKGLILIASEYDQLQPYVAPLAKRDKEKVMRSWPGPVTWLLPKAATTPAWLTGHHDTLAVRVSAHPLVRGLCDAYGGAIVSTSANPSGLAPARSLLRARLYFAQEVDFYLSGSVDRRAQPSRIMDMKTGKRLR